MYIGRTRYATIFPCRFVRFFYARLSSLLSFALVAEKLVLRAPRLRVLAKIAPTEAPKAKTTVWGARRRRFPETFPPEKRKLSA